MLVCIVCKNRLVFERCLAVAKAQKPTDGLDQEAFRLHGTLFLLMPYLDRATPYHYILEVRAYCLILNVHYQSRLIVFPEFSDSEMVEISLWLETIAGGCIASFQYDFSHS